MKEAVWKRILIILLIVCLCSALAAPGAAANLSDESAAKAGFDVFQAYKIIYKDGQYEYLMNRYQSPLRMEIESKQQDQGWQNTLTAWRAATFDIGSGASDASKEKGYYEAFLFNILYDEENGNLGADYFGVASGLAGHADKIAKSLGASVVKKISDAANEIVVNMDKTNLSQAEMESLWTTMLNTRDLSNAADLVGKTTKYLGYCKTGLDLLEKLCKVEVLARQAKEYEDILYSLSERETSNSFLKAALVEYNGIASGCLDEATISGIFTGETALTEASKAVGKALWSKLLSINPFTKGMLIGQAVGKFTDDLLFGTSDTITSYYNMLAYYQFEDLMKAETLARQHAFESNPTPENGKRFVSAYKLMMKTFIEGLDSATKYINKASVENLVSRIWNFFHKDDAAKLKELKESIENIKSSLLTSLTYCDELSLNYYLNVLASMEDGASAIDMSGAQPVQQTVSDEEFQTAYQDLKTRDQSYGTWVITSDDGPIELKSSRTVFGNVKIRKAGLLYLNGYRLTINGSLSLVDGCIDFCEDGKLYVGGDVIASTDSERESGASLNMSGYLAEFQVDGDFTWDSPYYAELGGGTMRVGGDFFTNDHVSADNNFQLILNGTGKQNVSVMNDVKFPYLAIQNQNGVTWKGYLNTGCVQNDATITSNGAKLNISDMNGKTLTIQGDVSFVYSPNESISLTSGVLNINGNATQYDGVNIDGGVLNVSGKYEIQGSSLWVVNGDCSIKGNLVIQPDEFAAVLIRDGRLWVHGNVLQYGGAVDMGKGSMSVDGDYLAVSVNGRITEAGLSLSSEYSTLRVNGDFKWNSNYQASLQNGNMLVGGDVSFENAPFLQNDFCLTLNGSGQQNVTVKEDASFPNLVVENQNCITWNGYLGINHLQRDANLSCSGTVVNILHMNGHTLNIQGSIVFDQFWGADSSLTDGVVNVTGNVTQSNHVYLGNGRLNVGGKYEVRNGYLYIESGETDIGGNLVIQQDAVGGVDVGSGQLRVHGNVLQYAGTLDLSAGSVYVDGDYVAQSTKGREADATLSMANMDNLLCVTGDFTWKSNYEAYLVDGELMVGGDFYAASFNTSGDCLVILNGTDVQNVTLEDGWFETLKLTQPIDQYVFSPEKCWNKLITKPPKITGQPQSVTAYEDEIVQFTVSASGDYLKYQWQYKSPGGTSWENSGMTGAKTSKLSVKATAARNGQQYRCVVSNDTGSVNSSAATLTVLQKFAITSQPKNVTAVVNSTAKFAVTATGSDLAYQWQYRTSASGEWKNCTTTGAKTAELSIKAETYRNGYQYRCNVTDAYGKTIPSEPATLTVKLPAPTLTVTLNAKGQPYLTWTAVDGAAKYEIWRATSSGGTYTKLSTTTGKSLTNSSAAAGSTYYYKVRAVDANGTAGAYSAVKSVRASLAAPTLTVTLNAKGQPYLTWTAVTGAAKYEIWRATSSGGTYTKLSTTTGKSLTNSSAAAGTTYFYKVRAVDANGAAGVYSAVKSVKTSLAAPTLTVTLNAKGQPYLTWTAVTGAAKYEIWCATSENGTYTKLSTTTGKSLTNSSAAAGTTYFYKVRAIASDGAAGVFSAVKSTKASIPTLTVKLNAKGQPHLTWTAVTGAAKYEIWRATSENGTYTKLSTTTGKTLTNSSVTVGTTYFYKVRAIASDGAAGQFSAVKSIRVRLAAPTLTVKLNAKGQPYLTWTAVTGAAKYEIWRSTSENGTYTKLSTTTGKSLTNSSAASGVTYYYKVRAVGADGYVGVFSTVKSVTAR